MYNKIVCNSIVQYDEIKTINYKWYIQKQSITNGIYKSNQLQMVYTKTINDNMIINFDY